MRIFVTIMMLIAMTGCNAMKGLPDKYKAGSFILEHVPANAPENYRKGWIDGCKTGLGSMSNSFYHSNYEMTQDQNMLKDATYYKIWKDALTYCRHYVYGLVRENDTRLRLQNNRQSAMERIGWLTGGAHNILDYTLNFWGPGSAGLYLENWGETAGNGFFEQAGVADFSDDMAMNGKGQGFGSAMTWDFKPSHSIVPY